MHTGMYLGAPLIIASVLLMIWNPRSACETEPSTDR